MKGIKFFGILAAASLLFSVSAFAQENNNRDENGNVVKGPYVTNNSFWDNTFVNLGIGLNGGMNLENGGSVPFVQRDGGLAVDLGFGKWFTPTVGARLNYLGISNEVNDGGFGNTPQHFITGDLLWSFTDAVWGYKETRKWNVAPYASAGLGMIGGDNEWLVGAGILNNIFLTERLGLMVDLRAMIAKASTYQVPSTKTIGRFEFPVSLTVGLAYKLGKTGFNRLSSVMPVVIPVPFTTDQYNALADKVKALEAENSELKDKIAALEDENAKLKNMLTDENDYVYEDGQFKKVSKPVATPATVYFNIDSAVISEREKAHLEFYAENLAEDAQLLLVGSADKETGTAAYNQKLSEKRAEAVKKYFVSKGVSADNIETRGEGSSNNVYNTPAKNRACTIKIK